MNNKDPALSAMPKINRWRYVLFGLLVPAFIAIRIVSIGRFMAAFLIAPLFERINTLKLCPRDLHEFSY